jgi:predicted dehydrogenase
MNFLVIGLGSMGKRRVRCFKALGISTVAGFDQREDRLLESREKYGIETFSDIHRAMREFRPDALIISVPPGFLGFNPSLNRRNQANRFPNGKSQIGHRLAEK